MFLKTLRTNLNVFSLFLFGLDWKLERLFYSVWIFLIMQMNKHWTSPSKSYMHFFPQRVSCRNKVPQSGYPRRALSPQSLNMLSANTCTCGTLLSERKGSSPTVCITVITSAFSHFLPEQPLLHFHFFFENSQYINQLASPKDLWNLLKSVEKV